MLTDSATDTRTGILIEHGPTRQIFEDPRDSRTQAYVTGRVRPGTNAPRRHIDGG